MQRGARGVVQQLREGCHRVHTRAVPRVVARRQGGGGPQKRGAPKKSAAGALADPPRGEVALVIGPAPPETGTEADLDAALLAAMAEMSVRDAAASVALAMGLPRRAVYARALALTRG